MTDPRRRTPVADDAPSSGRGRQILLIFLVIGIAAIAVMQFHALVPGMDQLVAVTPVVLIVVVASTVLLLIRQARRR